MNNTGDRSAWLHNVAFRFKSHWWLKAPGTTLATIAFMVVYFALLEHPQFPVTAVPWTPVDRLVAFRPWAIVPYVSLWVYVSLVPMFLLLRQELLPYLSTVCLLSVIGLTIFLFWPTTVVQPAIDWRLYSSVDFLKTVAPSGNACPSMHVAFSVLTALWLQRLLKRMAAPAILRWINVIWCLFILWSTMALKQHLVLDVVAGAALALVIVVPHLYFTAASAAQAHQPLPTTD